MNDDEFSEKPSAFMSGKEFIIVLVIIFSGLSFTLGYFVGKSTAPKPEPALQAVESSGQIQKQELLPAAPSPAAPPPEQSQPASPMQQPVLPPTKIPVPQVVPAAEKPAPPQQSAGPQMTKPATEKAEQKVEPATASERKDSMYTVQIGAFRNIAEAKQLKAKFSKKGYKPYISAGKNKKAEKIFKVKTGEFTEKKEAELLALKLKKTEGLQTYVTMKTE
ncbi:MAG: SPOR domain-containing protein [Nitrospirae bacterium]|nr:SPOR domain-containing protein [Nitrospirota bacterium]